jgi:L-seryl-tRNA(Ser) seleniumtransferase
MTLAALEATLSLYRDGDRARRDIPVLRMLTLEAGQLEALAHRLASEIPPDFHPEVVPGESAVGGGSFPGTTLPTFVVALDAGALGAEGLALRLRLGDPAIIARVQGDRVLLDPRTLPEDSFAAIGAALGNNDP